MRPGRASSTEVLFAIHCKYKSMQIAPDGATPLERGGRFAGVSLVLLDVVRVEAVAADELVCDRKARLGAQLKVVPGGQGHELARREGPTRLVVVVGRDQNLVVLVRAGEEVLDLVHDIRWGGRRVPDDHGRMFEVVDRPCDV